MSKLTFTPWFNIKADGPPVRVGVYEGAAAGRPGDGGGTFQHGYYYWDGERWSHYGQTPEVAAERHSRSMFQASNWRGVIPSAKYPFESVKAYVPNYFAGVLARDGAADCVNVIRFTPGPTELSVKFVRKRGTHEPENYDCKFYRQGSEFIGSTHARIRNFDSSLRVEVRFVCSQQGQDAVRVTMTLREAGVVTSFAGVLNRPSQVA